MSFLFGSSKAKRLPSVRTPSVSTEPVSAPISKTRRGARLALFATQGGAFGLTGTTPTARRKLLGN